MSQEKGEVGTAGAGRLLGVAQKTIRAWCRKAEDGLASPLAGAVRRDYFDRFWISRAHVLTLREQRPDRRF